MPPPAATYPIDLATALRLADVANPTIGAARTMILEALALQLTARTLLLPSLNSGVTYHGHDGLLQRVSGQDDRRLAPVKLYVGSGVGPFGSSGTATLPGVNIFSQLTDAWFEPLAARQRLAGARFGAQATSYDILLDVALLHLELLGNQSILDLQRLSETQFHEVYRLTQRLRRRRRRPEPTPTVPCRNGNGASPWFKRPRKTWPSPRPGSPTGSTSTRLCGSSRSAARWSLSHLVPIDTPQQELIQVALRQRPDIAARGGRDRRSRGALQARNRPTLIADPLAGIQRRRLRRRQ